MASLAFRKVKKELNNNLHGQYAPFAVISTGVQMNNYAISTKEKRQILLKQV